MKHSNDLFIKNVHCISCRSVTFTSFACFVVTDISYSFACDYTAVTVFSLASVCRKRNPTFAVTAEHITREIRLNSDVLTAIFQITSHFVFKIKTANRYIPNDWLFRYMKKRQQTYCLLSFVLYGGDGRDRTDDLHTASVALSQLSYAPISL